MKLSLLSKLRGCLQYTKGTASVEAAIIFPVVFWAYASMFKYFEAYRAQAVAEKSAYTISDMISRETLAIIPSDMTNARNVYKDLSSLSPGKTALRVTLLRWDGNEKNPKRSGSSVAAIFQSRATAI